MCTRQGGALFSILGPLFLAGLFTGENLARESGGAGSGRVESVMCFGFAIRVRHQRIVCSFTLRQQKKLIESILFPSEVQQDHSSELPEIGSSRNKWR